MNRGFMTIQLLFLYCYRAFVFACITGLIYTFSYLINHLIRKKMINTSYFFISLFFVCYIACLLQITVIRDWQLFFNYNAWTHSLDTVQLEAFHTLSNAYNYKLSTFIYHCFGNILWFVPMGCLLPLINRWFDKAYKVVIFGGLFSVMIEIAQWVCNSGVSDIDDVMTNTLGTLLGYIIYIVIKKWKK